MTPTEILALADECEQAEQGSRELSDRVLLGLGWRQRQSGEAGILLPDEFMIVDPDGKQHIRAKAPDPSRSVDACLEAVPEGWAVHLHEASGPGRTDWSAVLFLRKTYPSPYDSVDCKRAHSAALSLSAALLRARAAEMDD